MSAQLAAEGSAELAESPRAVIARHAATFSAASLFLPAASRDDIAVLYKFCRTIDDLADEQADPAALRRVLAELRSERQPSPISAPMLALGERGAPLQAAIQLVEGCLSDIGSVQLETERDLVRYGYAVAGTVGRLCCPLIGVTEPAAIRFAIDLGVAMQLSNIARDVGEDAKRDRVYLPRQWLIEEGCSPEDVKMGRSSGRVVRVVARTLALAERYYASAELGLRYIPLRPRLAVALAARRYRGIGRAVLARGEPALADRTLLGPLSRARYLLQAPLVALAAGLAREVEHDPSGHTHLDGLYP